MVPGGDALSSIVVATAVIEKARVKEHARGGSSNQITYYSQYKLKLNGRHIHHNVISLLLCFGGAPTTMDVILATIIVGRQAQIQLNIGLIQIYLFLHYFIEFNLTFQGWPWTIHAQVRPPIRRHGFIKSKPLEGGAAPSSW